MLKYIVIIVSVILLSGCLQKNDTTVTKKNNTPKWLNDPYIDNDQIAAIGCSQLHFKGITAQKDLAISRAINRIAIQNSVIVDNITYRQKNNSNDKKRGTSISATSSLHTVEKTKISTKTKAIYTKIDGEICAWVVQK
jgi:hypothetical protein